MNNFKYKTLEIKSLIRKYNSKLKEYHEKYPLKLNDTTERIQEKKDVRENIIKGFLKEIKELGGYQRVVTDLKMKHPNTLIIDYNESQKCFTYLRRCDIVFPRGSFTPSKSSTIEFYKHGADKIRDEYISIENKLNKIKNKMLIRS